MAEAEDNGVNGGGKKEEPKVAGGEEHKPQVSPEGF
jgi:hypothetical protein